MAGGMSNRTGRPSLAERSGAMGHGTVNTPPHHQPGPRGEYGRECTHRDLPDGPSMVYVTAGPEPTPGLLLGWRKHPQLPWEGLVKMPQVHGDRWVLVETWWPGGAIAPASY